jgi:hypothetical protein
MTDIVNFDIIKNVNTSINVIVGDSANFNSAPNDVVRLTLSPVIFTLGAPSYLINPNVALVLSPIELAVSATLVTLGPTGTGELVINGDGYWALSGGYLDTF